MLTCIDKFGVLVDRLSTYENFEKKWIEQDAMIRNFEIIGEASSHISEELKKQFPSIEWKKMKAMRNFMTHQYFGLQLDTIWDTAINDLPYLKKQIDEVLAFFENETKK